MSSDVIRVHDVSKRFNIHKDKSLKERVVNFRRSQEHAEDFWALRDISFDLTSGATLGLIGRNGSGKSTLLKVVGGILTPNTGYVERRGRLAALLELGAGFHGDLTGRENVFLNASILGLTRKQTEQYFDEIVDFSGIEEFIDTQVKFYSSGMYVRLAFAVAVHVDPEILLIDEVLAVGDEPFQRKCLERIRQFQREGRTIVLVTHGMDQVRQLCDRVIMLERGVMLLDGKPVDALRAFRERYSAEGELLASETGDHRQVEITRVEITDAAGIHKERFEALEDVGVEVDVVAHTPVDDWAVRLTLHNHDEVLVYEASTVDLIEAPHGALDGSIRLRLVFPRVPLAEGQYFITASVHPEVGPDYHRLERAAFFKVLTAQRQEGLVHMPPRVTVLSS